MCVCLCVCNAMATATHNKRQQQQQRNCAYTEHNIQLDILEYFVFVSFVTNGNPRSREILLSRSHEDNRCAVNGFANIL